VAAPPHHPGPIDAARAGRHDNARRGKPRGLVLCAALCCLAAVLLADALRPTQPVLKDDFTGADGLVTNEHADTDRGGARIPRSPTWRVTSGSLFRRSNQGWTGHPDEGSPDDCSCAANGSAVFRMISRRTDLRNADVSFALRTVKLTATHRTPPRAWDGVHIALRWQSPRSTYYASVNRRDNHVVIKKKIPGGPANGGTYVALSPATRWVVPYRREQHVRATIRTRDDGAVVVRLTVDNKPIAQAVDRGIGGAPIRSPGAIGIRGDNAEFTVDAMRVTAAG
jgi:hypothetical protein